MSNEIITLKNDLTLLQRSIDDTPLVEIHFAGNDQQFFRYFLIFFVKFERYALYILKKVILSYLFFFSTLPL